MANDNRVFIGIRLDPALVSAKDLIGAAQAFARLIQSVSKSVGGDEFAEWEMRVREGSNVLEASLPASLNPDVAFRCYEAIEGGLNLLEDAPQRPDKYDDQAITQAKVLAEVLSRVGGVFNGRDSSRKITMQTSANAEKVLGVPLSGIGSVEGRLVLMKNYGRPEIAVEDRLTGRIVRCDFGDLDLDELAPHFLNRVAVRGLISYRRTGEIRKIAVSDYRVLRGRADLPSADDVKGILRDH